MLFSICQLEENQELYTTLYAQRLFFVVQQNKNGMVFEPVTRMDARMKVEQRLRKVRRLGPSAELNALQDLYKRTFQ